jgi:hypothetical protein
VVREADEVRPDDLTLAAGSVVNLREDARPLAL